MSARVAVVTDSTAALPADLVGDLTVVPLQVVLGDRTLDDCGPETVELLLDAFERRLPVTTSRVGPATFARVYADLARDGADAVVSVHLSAALSGTYESAVLAARDAPVPVRVVDSGLIGMGLGFAALAAAAAVGRGGSAEEAARAARDRAAGTATLFYVESLEYLRRGGRIGAAQAFLGSALAVKPLLRLHGGRIEPLEKVRTSAKALARLADLVVEAADGRAVQLTVHHLLADERAQAVADDIAGRLPRAEPPLVCEIDSVVAAHAGPGVLGVVVAPAL